MKTARTRKQWLADAGAIFSLFLPVIFAAMVLQDQRISASPATAVAVVDAKRVSDGGSEGPTYLEIRYSFEAGSRGRFHGHADVGQKLYDRLSIGSRLEVQYAADDPTMSRVPGEFDEMFVEAFGVGLQGSSSSDISGRGAGSARGEASQTRSCEPLGVVATRRPRRDRSCHRHAGLRRVPGRLRVPDRQKSHDSKRCGRREAGLRTGGEPIFDLRYRHVAASGGEYGGWTRASREIFDRISVGDPLEIRYAGDAPEYHEVTSDTREPLLNVFVVGGAATLLIPVVSLGWVGVRRLRSDLRGHRVSVPS